MVDEAESKVSEFYDTVGWETKEGITEDARRWEDLREHAKTYVSKCRLRVLRHIPEKGDKLLDMASGPIQYTEYLEYSKNFSTRYCVDLSKKALEDAEKRIGKHGVYLHGSFLDIPMQSSFFDCVVSLHTIYHIDKNKQEEAVRKLLDVVRPGKPVIIVYNNPSTVEDFLKWILLIRLVRRVRRVLRGGLGTKGREATGELYFESHPIDWWLRFSDAADVKIYPWRSLSSETQKRLIPNNKFGENLFDLLFALEERFPRFFARHFRYPMIVLRKRGSSGRDASTITSSVGGRNLGGGPGPAG